MPNTKILVVVDTQIDFVMTDGHLPVAGAEQIITPGIRFLTKLDPVTYAAALFTFDTHHPDEYLGSPENLGVPEKNIPGFPLHCVKGTPGWENVFNPNLVPQPIPAYRLEKDVFDMWEKPGDDTLVYPIMREAGLASAIGRNRESFFDHLVPPTVDTATVLGVASDFCVAHAIRGLLARGLKVEVVADLTAGILRDIAQTIADDFPGRVSII